MNNLDKQYQLLLQDILNNGVEKKDRTGTGTLSVFGRQIRHKMSEGFPLLTSKKMAWKTMVTELLWFLRGDTNIKYLVDNDCHIWDGDAYKNYQKITQREIELNSAMKSHPHYGLSKEEFINKIKGDKGFAKRDFVEKWGELGPIYGKQWRKWQGWMEYGDEGKMGSIWYDQIQRLIHMLKTEPDSRRLMVSAWNVGELDEMVLPPCHYGFQVYTRQLTYEERYKIWFQNNFETGFEFNTNDKIDFENEFWEPTPQRAISLSWNQRSVDTFLGLPFNISSYGLLLSLFGKLTNMVPEDLIGNLGDTHLYLNHLEQAKEQIKRNSFQLPSLELDFEFTYKDGYIVEWPSSLLEKIKLKNYVSNSSLKAPLSN